MFSGCLGIISRIYRPLSPFISFNYYNYFNSSNYFNYYNSSINHSFFCFSARLLITINSTSTVTKMMVDNGRNSGVSPPLRASA